MPGLGNACWAVRKESDGHEVLAKCDLLLGTVDLNDSFDLARRGDGDSLETDVSVP